MCFGGVVGANAVRRGVVEGVVLVIEGRSAREKRTVVDHGGELAPLLHHLHKRTGASAQQQHNANEGGRSSRGGAAWKPEPVGGCDAMNTWRGGVELKCSEVCGDIFQCSMVE